MGFFTEAFPISTPEASGLGDAEFAAQFGLRSKSGAAECPPVLDARWLVDARSTTERGHHNLGEIANRPNRPFTYAVTMRTMSWWSVRSTAAADNFNSRLTTSGSNYRINCHETKPT